tara:strand:+ start:1087 stop:1743 length:657 start_codon:yes stop_codon:yes gene_type:complete
MNLKKIFDKYGTDKSVHHEYYKPYEENFEYLRDKKINLLEIGIRDGNSLRAWKEYFPNGNIYGMDIHPSCIVMEKEGFNVVIGDQGLEDDLNKFGDTQFDIIIDDGSHFTKHIVKSFHHLFNKNLKSNGIYVVEDLGCTYIKEFEQTTSSMNNPKGQNLNTITQNDRSDIIKLIESIHVNMDLYKWGRGREGYNPNGPTKKLYQKFVSYTDILFVYKS